ATKKVVVPIGIPHRFSFRFAQHPLAGDPLARLQPGRVLPRGRVPTVAAIHQCCQRVPEAWRWAVLNPYRPCRTGMNRVPIHKPLGSERGKTVDPEVPSPNKATLVYFKDHFIDIALITCILDSVSVSVQERKEEYATALLFL
ncbi:MAG: hypothetical protein HGA87_04400, partial [Desulfobulbaceae bacterium]|nr:hypothetical protein [Desulfobulbaceae bacterium]